MGKLEERPEWIREFIVAKMAVRWEERYLFSEIGKFYESDAMFNRYYGNSSLYEGTKLMARFGWAENWKCDPDTYVPF